MQLLDRRKIHSLSGARKRAPLEASPLNLFLTDPKPLLGYSSSKAAFQTSSTSPGHQSLTGIGVNQTVHFAQFNCFFFIRCLANGGAELLDGCSHGSTVLAVAYITLLARDQAFLTTFIVWQLTKPPFGTTGAGI